jgi:hypothetical protein
VAANFATIYQWVTGAGKSGADTVPGGTVTMSDAMIIADAAGSLASTCATQGGNWSATVTSGTATTTVRCSDNADTVEE